MEKTRIVKEDRHNVISEQVKELRKYCTELKEYGGWWNNRLACKVNDAADTIESLSAKLDMNTQGKERSV